MCVFPLFCCVYGSPRHGLELAYILAKLPAAPQTFFKPLMGALDLASSRIGATLSATSEYRHDLGSREWMAKYSHLLSEDQKAALRDSRFNSYRSWQYEPQAQDNC
jgi:hypothetical protein